MRRDINFARSVMQSEFDIKLQAKVTDLYVPCNFLPCCYICIFVANNCADMCIFVPVFEIHVYFSLFFRKPPHGHRLIGC